MNDNPPKLSVVHGRKDILEMLDELREAVVAGKVEAAATFAIPEDGPIEISWAYADDMPYAWSRMMAGAVNLKTIIEHDFDQ